MEVLPVDIVRHILTHYFSFGQRLGLRRVCRSFRTILSVYLRSLTLTGWKSWKRQQRCKRPNDARLILAQASEGLPVDDLCLSFPFLEKLSLDASFFSSTASLEIPSLERVLNGLTHLSVLKLEDFPSPQCLLGVFPLLKARQKLVSLSLGSNVVIENAMDGRFGDASIRQAFGERFWDFLSAAPQLRKLRCPFGYAFEECSRDDVLERIAALCPLLTKCDVGIPEKRNILKKNQILVVSSTQAVVELDEVRASQLEELNFTWRYEGNEILPLPCQLTGLRVLQCYHGSHGVSLFKQNRALRETSFDFVNKGGDSSDWETVEKICLDGLGSNLTVISFFCCSWPPSTWRALGFLRNLREIYSCDVNDVDDASMQAWASGIMEGSAGKSKLEVIDHRFARVTCESLLRHVAVLCPRLEFVRCGDEGLFARDIALLPSMPFSLTEIMCAGDTEAELSAYLQSGKAAHLRRISFELWVNVHVATLSDFFVSLLVKHCPLLKVLRFGPVVGVTEMGWRTLIEGAKNLQLLECASDTFQDPPASSLRLVVRTSPGPLAVEKELEHRKAKAVEAQRLLKKEHDEAAVRGAQFFAKFIHALMLDACQNAPTKAAIASLDTFYCKYAEDHFGEQIIQADVNPKGFRKGILQSAKALKANVLKERFSTRK